MFCKKCGKKIEDNSEFCSYCGEKQENSERELYEEIVPENRAIRKTMVHIVRILLIIGIVCFFCPFVMVSCGGQTETATGIELISSIGEVGMLDEQSNPNPSIIILIAICMGGIALCFAFMRDMIAEAGFTAEITAACLVLFQMTFMRYCKAYAGNYIQVKFQWGWILALFIYILAGICAFYVWKSGEG